MKKFIWILVFPVILFSYPLDLTFGGRAAGMGGAFTAISDDALCLYYNPGGISMLHKGESTFMHWNFGNLDMIHINMLSVVSPVTDKVGVGFGWVSKSADLKQMGYTPLDTTMMSDNQFTFGVGIKLYKNIGIGINFQRFMLSSDTGGKSGFGVDIGIKTRYPNTPFYAGFAIKNLTAGMGDEYYPSTYRFGVAFMGLPISRRRYIQRKEKSYRLAVSADISTKPWGIVQNDTLYKEGLIHCYFGMEYSPMEWFSFRAGYNDLEDIAFGLRIGYSIYFFDFSYAQGKKDSEFNVPIFGASYKLAFTVKM